MMTAKVRIGGVPEHFNYTWHKMIEEGLLDDISVQWIDCPGGTGAMAQGIHEGELDIAIMLTEGAVAAIAKGCPARIAHFAVDSPLVWGIHTGAKSDLHVEQDVKGKTYAISRYGSGSHLMAIVHAAQQGWSLEHMKWLEVKNLDGAKKALVSGEADVFLWERFTTKPLVDEGSFRLLGLLPTPWPAFVVVVSNAFMVQHASHFYRISEKILAVQKNIVKEKDLSSIISNRYQLKKVDVEVWLKSTKWSSSNEISEASIEPVIETLKNNNILNNSSLSNFLVLSKE